MNADALISKLEGVQGNGPRWRAICPAHESKHRTRTLAVYEAEDGRVLVKCHAGCDVQSIVGAVGLDLSDLFPPKPIGERPRIKTSYAPHPMAGSKFDWSAITTDYDETKPIGRGPTEFAAIMDLVKKLENAA